MAIAGSGIAQEASAAQVNYFFGYRVEHSDNIRRVATNEEKETLNVLRAGIVYRDINPELDVRFAPTAEYLDYKRDTFDDEARLTLDSSLVWTLSPQRLTWTVQDNARQVRIDPTQPETPANTALANLLVTGPDLYVRFSTLNTLQLGARYVNVYIEDTDLDNERSEVYGRWLYQYTPITVLSLNYEAQDTRFENPAAFTPDFERQDAYFRVATRQARSTFIADLGRSRIQREGAPEVAGGLARLTWTRQSTLETNYGLLAESGFADTGTDLAATAAAANAPAGGSAQTVSQNLVAQDIFRAKRADVFFQRTGTRFASNLRLSERRLEFQGRPLDDRNERAASLTLTYLYSAEGSLGVYGGRERIEYRNQALDDTDATVGIRWLRWITRKVSITVDARREERSSTDPTRDFVEDRVLFGVLYTSGPIQRGQ